MGMSEGEKIRHPVIFGMSTGMRHSYCFSEFQRTLKNEKKSWKKFKHIWENSISQKAHKEV